MARPAPVLPDVGSTMVPPGSRSPSRSAASTMAIAQGRRGLDARTGGDGFARIGYDDRSSGEVGDDTPKCRRPRAPTDQHDVAAGPDPGASQRIEPVEQPADHAFHGRPRELLP